MNLSPGESLALQWALIGFVGFLVWHELTLRLEDANMPAMFLILLGWLGFMLLKATGTI